MLLTFNMMLREAKIPLDAVRLLRHKDQRAVKGRTPYELWRDDRSQFEWYQSTQMFKNRVRLKSSYWASFVGTPKSETMFVGIYGVKYRGVLEKDTPQPHIDEMQRAGSCDVYDLKMDQRFRELDGRLLIDWGYGKRSWVQRADLRDKPIVELRIAFKEDDFPGFLAFREPLSRLSKLPKGWIDAIKASRGIYLLTCPKTKEQYVGSAIGKDGFWGRWQEYVRTGHGGNVALKSHDPSDYHVSILEIAGTAADEREIFGMEERWKLKLESKKMGLNR